MALDTAIEELQKSVTWACGEIERLRSEKMALLSTLAVIATYPGVNGWTDVENLAHVRRIARETVNNAKE